jgi:hypothetical protein
MSNWVDDMISDKHIRIARLLVVSFCSNYNSSDNKIKSNAIIQKLRERGFSIGDAELRDIIGYIRRNDLCSPGFILSDNNGYWYSENENEMQKVWQSNHGRALEIMANFAPLHKRFKHLISEQNSIFK